MAGAGGGGALGLGMAIARGGVAVVFTRGVSDGFGELFSRGLGDFSVFFFFFFFDVGDVSFPELFFGFGCVVGSGVSLRVGDSAAIPVGVFFFFGRGEGVGDFCFLRGEAFAVAVGVGVSSESTARAFKIRGDFSGSEDCAWIRTDPISALSAREIFNQARNCPTATQRNRVLRPINRATSGSNQAS